MPTITIRVSAEERAALEAAASRSEQTLSEHVRQTLALRASQVADHERRISELERLVNR